MKTLIRTLALIPLMLLGCVGLMGQKSLILQDIQPLLTYSSDTRSNTILSADNSLKSYQFYLEERIQLREWMVSKEEWMAQVGSGLISDNFTEREQELKVEDWMLESFGTGDLWLNVLVKEEKETPVKLQDWMLCCQEWQAEGIFSK